MSQPLFSVVISSYQLREYIRDAVLSVLSQDFEDLECVVVDDGSTDGSPELLLAEAEKDSRLRVILSENRGVSHARNLGLEAARGRYISFLDGDDTLSPDCLSASAREIENDPETDLVIFGIRYIDYAAGKGVSEIASLTESSPKPLFFEDGGEAADWYIENHALLLYSTGNKFYRTSRLREAGISFREEMDFGEDRILNYDYLKVCGHIHTVPRAFYNYRHINASSLSTRFRPHHIEETVALHRAKIDCVNAIAKRSTEEQKAAFEDYDRKKELIRGLEHIIIHAGTLGEAELLDEFRTVIRVLRDELPQTRASYSETTRALIESANRLLFPAGGERDLSGYDKVLVLGSNYCDYRIREALRLFGSRDDVLFICSGGNPSKYTDESGSAVIEADYMAKVLTDEGIPAERIVTDSSARNTWENLQNSERFLRDGKACVVTAAFHVPRVEEMLGKQGLSALVMPAYGPRTRPDNWFLNQEGISVILTETEKHDRALAGRLAMSMMDDILRETKK